ncbi:MAG: CARDB domain-containing protein [Nanoarchaeota archaeon]
MKIFSTLLFILLLSTIVYGAYFLYGELDRKNYNITPITNTQDEIPSIPQQNSQSKQFYNNMRFTDKQISYYFDERCSEEKINQLEKAFSIFEDETILELSQNSDGEIYIACSEIAPDPQTEGHFVAGEGGPTKVINGTKYAIILEGKISLFEDEECSRPNIAVHELFHVFGFDHNNDRKSILYPTLDCSQIYNQYLFDRINELYTTPSLPDLRPQNIELEKTGRYLKFSIEVSNDGLKEANQVDLDLFIDNEKTNTFELGDIDIGVKKIFSVENLRVPRGAKKVEFKVDSSSKIPEISDLNNNAEFNIED